MPFNNSKTTEFKWENSTLSFPFSIDHLQLDHIIHSNISILNPHTSMGLSFFSFILSLSHCIYGNIFGRSHVIAHVCRVHRERERHLLHDDRVLCVCFSIRNRKMCDARVGQSRAFGSTAYISKDLFLWLSTE